MNDINEYNFAHNCTNLNVKDLRIAVSKLSVIGASRYLQQNKKVANLKFQKDPIE